VGRQGIIRSAGSAWAGRRKRPVLHARKGRQEKGASVGRTFFPGVTVNGFARDARSGTRPSKIGNVRLDFRKARKTVPD